LSLTPERFREVLQEAKLYDQFPVDSIASLVSFTEKMLEINQTCNLTRWTEDEDVLTYHLLDSAYCVLPLKKLNEKKGINKSRWLDLGSGCGFPGALLAAAFPQDETTFLDSVVKKVKALEECVKAAGWHSSLLACRAEELGKVPSTRASWNGVTARAVADFRVVLEYAMPLLITGGYLVYWATQDQLSIVDNSQKALTELKAQIVEKIRYVLPNTHNIRWIVIVEKLGTTPEKYPRPIGRALKQPLI
jgi:16S rRNA (guanine527-N7)-methyltransferase